jgi:hypothetical protein
MIKHIKTLLTPIEYACGIFAGLTILNFLVFVVLTMHLGGDALNGKIENSHYYLWGYNAHTGKKDCTEVKARVFQYSKYHLYTIFITWPIMLAGGFALKLTENRRRGPGRGLLSELKKKRKNE